MLTMPMASDVDDMRRWKSAFLAETFSHVVPAEVGHKKIAIMFPSINTCFAQEAFTKDKPN